MANRFPLVANASTSRIAELATGDGLDLTGSDIVNASNVTILGTSTLGAISNVKITGGTSGQVISTDGAGNLSFATGAIVSGSNTQIQFNNAGALGSSANLTFNSSTKVFTVDSATISNTITSTQYVETRTAPTISAGALTLDLSLCNVFDVNLSGSVTSITISNAPTSGKAFGFTLKLNITSGFSYTITWPASVKWPSGTAPTLTTTSGKVDVFEFFTVDGGTTYYGFTAGQNL